MLPTAPSSVLALAIIAPLAGCGGAAPPVARPTPPAPAISADMASLAFYAGRWTCHGDELDAAGASTKAYDLTIEVTPQLDGSWFEIVVLEAGAPVTHELKGFDARDHKFHHVWATAEGAWGSLTADGWTGRQLVFVDDKPAPDAPPERMVFEKLSDAHYTHRAEIQDGASWRPTFVKDCAKAS